MVHLQVDQIHTKNYCSIITSYDLPKKDHPPVFGKKAYRRGIYDAVNAPVRFLSEDLGEKLNCLFEKVLDECTHLFGTGNDGRLASFFAAKIKECKEWEHEVDYRNRTYVLQAVIISRANTWAPDAVDPLFKIEGNDRLVCTVISQACQHCRSLLMNDLVVVERLITWFRDHD